MFESLHHTLGALPDATLLYPGHLYAAEPSSTLGEQKRTNPYLRVSRPRRLPRLHGRSE